MTNRIHSALGYLTPVDVYFGGEKEVLLRRELVKQQTISERRA